MHDIDGTAAVSWSADRIDLFWVDTDGALVHRAFRAGTWDEPESLGGTLASAPALLTTVVAIRKAAQAPARA